MKSASPRAGLAGRRTTSGTRSLMAFIATTHDSAPMSSQPCSSRARRARVGLWLFPGLRARIRATTLKENLTHIKSRREEYRTAAGNAQGS
jgi:hypothetical protein